MFLQGAEGSLPRHHVIIVVIAGGGASEISCLLAVGEASKQLDRVEQYTMPFLTQPCHNTSGCRRWCVGDQLLTSGGGCVKPGGWSGAVRDARLCRRARGGTAGACGEQRAGAH